MTTPSATDTTGATGPEPTNLMQGPTPEQGLVQTVQAWWTRVRSGDVGSLPAVLGLLVLVVLFSALRPASFPTAGNMANLLVQAAAIIVLAMGLVFVLLLGEIDLSAGVAGGVAAGVMAKLFVSSGVSWIVAVPAAVLTGIVIGLVIGLLVSVVGIPSFVVTLALFLALQGITLQLIGVGGTVPVNDSTVLAIANSNVPPAVGWVLAVLVSIALVAGAVFQWSRQRRQGVSRSNLTVALVRAGVLSVIVLAVTAVLNENRARVATVDLSGIPYAVPLIGVLLVIWSFVLGRTRYGRHIYAVGGNAEAARRAGHLRDVDPGVGLRHRVGHGGALGHHLRLPPELGDPGRRSRQHPAVRGRRGRHRRHEPLRRQGPGEQRRHRWSSSSRSSTTGWACSARRRR